jgi:hypothetical protein
METQPAQNDAKFFQDLYLWPWSGNLCIMNTKSSCRIAMFMKNSPSELCIGFYYLHLHYIPILGPLCKRVRVQTFLACFHAKTLFYGPLDVYPLTFHRKWWLHVTFLVLNVRVGHVNMEKPKMGQILTIVGHMASKWEFCTIVWNLSLR